MIFLSLLVGYMIVPWRVFLASGGWVEEEFCKARKSGFSCCHVELDLCEDASSAEPIRKNNMRLGSLPLQHGQCFVEDVCCPSEAFEAVESSSSTRKSLEKWWENFCNFKDVLWLRDDAKNNIAAWKAAKKACVPSYWIQWGTPPLY